MALVDGCQDVLGGCQGVVILLLGCSGLAGHYETLI